MMMSAMSEWFLLACLSMFIIAAALNPSRCSAEGAPPDYSTMRLVGAMKAGGSSVVVFENAKGEQTSYRTGETFADGSRIVAVSGNSIMVRQSDGSQVEYFVSPSGAGKPGAASTGRPATDSPPAYIPPPKPATNDPENVRVPRRKKQMPAESADVEE